jgi:hypothetical protein
VVDEAVGDRHGGHRIVEYLVPLAEDQIGGDDDGLLFVAFGQKLEEDVTASARVWKLLRKRLPSRRA